MVNIPKYFNFLKNWFYLALSWGLIECILINLLSIHIFLVIYQFTSFVHIKSEIVFLLLICQISLYILDSISLSHITYCQISSCLWLANLSSWCFSFWWSISFEKVYPFYFDEVLSIIFFSYDEWFLCPVEEMFALPKFVKAFLYIFFQKLYSNFYR